MNEKLSSRQMINNELAARAGNKRSLKNLKHHVPLSEQADLTILFNCECSDSACTERIPMSLLDYEQIHKTQARFVIVKGHNEPLVEEIKASNSTVAVVDKYAL